MIEHKAVTVLKSGIVIDKQMIAGLSAVNLGKLMADCYGEGLPVLMVESSHQFFRPDNFVELLKKADSNWILLAEKYKIELSAEDIRIMQRSFEIQTSIIAASRKVKDTYEFAKVPENWSVEAKINIGGSRISRKGGDGYSIGHKTLKRIWYIAYPVWSGVKGTVKVLDNVQASGYERNAHILNNSISIGCQDIQRFELEQVALSLGWEFP